MNRYCGGKAGLQPPTWLLFCAMAFILLGGISLFSPDLQRILIIPAGQTAALARIEKGAPETPATAQEFSAGTLRHGACGRSTEKSHPPGSKKGLLCAPPDPGALSSRLDRCTEFTKPDSVCIRLMGTPKNHRSPPA